MTELLHLENYSFTYPQQRRPALSHVTLTVPEEMRAAIRRLVEDPELRRSMGEAGRRRALTRSWEAINDDLIGYWHLAAELRAAAEYQVA